MVIQKGLLAFFIFLLGPSGAQAEMDKASEEALKQTQELLRSKGDRDKYIQSDPNAKAADKSAKELMGSDQNQQQLYELSAKIFETTTKATNGDAAKQKEFLEKAMQNPEAFFNSLPKEQQEAIRGLAEKVERERPGVGGRR